LLKPENEDPKEKYVYLKPLRGGGLT